MSVPAANSTIKITHGENEIEVQEKVLGEMKITLPTLLNGIASVQFKLDNTDSLYTGEFEEFDPLEVSLWRAGSEPTLIFSGRIMVIKFIGNINKNDYSLQVIAEGKGYKLISPPNFLKKKYDNEGGKQIMIDAVDLTDLGKLIDPGSECTSIHDYDFKYATPMQVLRQILRDAKAGAAIGFNGFVSVTGTVYIFERGRYGGNGIDLTGKIRNYVLSRDMHRVINEQTVYGIAKKCYPANQDLWTEPVLGNTSNMTADADSGQKIVSVVHASGFNVGDHVKIEDIASQECNRIANISGSDLIMEDNLVNNYTVAASGKVTELYIVDGHWESGQNLRFDDVKKLIGDHSIKTFGGPYYYLRSRFILNEGKEANCYDDYGLQNLALYVTMDDNFAGLLIVHLQDTASRWIERQVGVGKKTEWSLINIPCGRVNKEQWTYGSSGFSWNAVKVIRVYNNFIGSGSGTFWIDRLHFNNARFSHTASDQGSKDAYGTRIGKPIFDDMLNSDLDCQQVAERIINNLKVPLNNVESILVEGSKLFTPAYTQLIVLPNENVSELYHIDKITHIVEKTKWKVLLELIK